MLKIWRDKLFDGSVNAVMLRSVHVKRFAPGGPFCGKCLGSSVVSGALSEMTVSASAALEVTGDSGSLKLPGGSLEFSAIRLALPDSIGETPELSFKITNHTLYSWQTLDFAAEIQANCLGEKTVWKFPVSTNVGFVDGLTITRDVRKAVSTLAGKTANCVVVTTTLHLSEAISLNYRIEGDTGRIVDLQQEWAEKQAENTAQQKAEDLEAEKQNAKRKAQMRELRAAEARERARLRAICRQIYDQTANKRIADLTVREARAVQGCEAMNSYPPQ